MLSNSSNLTKLRLAIGSLDLLHKSFEYVRPGIALTDKKCLVTLPQKSGHLT
jgi:hypothetical protein